MRTSQQREAKYDAKTAATTVGLKVAAVLPGMKTGFAAAINELVQIEEQIQVLLNAAGVPTIQYPFYLCFGRELWSRENAGINGAALDAQAQASHDKWVSRGLASARLVEIADSVFNVTVT
jgi:hypothetical protein